ncbi:MAG: hypothetical protein MUF49_21160 [Oculatellaceae cyanobacterium Prado106]|nr:hypothetical protein [Oculatellaceae cyanobacterium Prado106]
MKLRSLKIRYVLLIGVLAVSTFDSASLAVNLHRSKAAAQPTQAQPPIQPIIQPQAQMRSPAHSSTQVTNWVHLGSRVYQLRQRMQRSPQSAQL